MKVLLTGASGFVGGAVGRRARELNWDVLALGRRRLSHAGYRSIDLSQPFDLDFQPDVVIHAAARSSPWGTCRDFESQCVDTTRHVLEFCARRGHPHFIHISTAAVLYRDEHQLALDEQTLFPAHPINEYARAKTRSEQLVRDYSGPGCILRPRAVFGPEDTVVFPRILRALERRRLPLFASDQPVLADLIYIDTLADCIARAARQHATGVYHLSQAEPAATSRSPPPPPASGPGFPPRILLRATTNKSTTFTNGSTANVIPRSTPTTPRTFSAPPSPPAFLKSTVSVPAPAAI